MISQLGFGDPEVAITPPQPPEAASSISGDSRKRRHSAEDEAEDENNNNGEKSGPRMGVEQQLAASSPGLLFQHALLNAASNGNAAAGEDADAAGTPGAMDMFEAQKMFQKFTSQLATGFGDVRPGPGAGVPPNPFVQQLASLSPFLLALQHQQQQFDSAGFLSIPPPLQQNNNGPSTEGFSPYDEECGGEEEDQLQPQQGPEAPEDLSLKNGSSGLGLPQRNGNATPNWSYSEQFKQVQQLYDLSDDPGRKEWLDDWLQFMGKIGKPMTRIPVMAKSVLDLYELYRLVVMHGGLVEVINKKLWREITKGLNLPNSITSAAFTLRSQYEKFLFDYECHRHNFSTHADLKKAINANKREGRRPPPPGSNSARATPSAGSQQHHRSHHASGARQSASESQVAQQQVAATRWMEQMAAVFSSATSTMPVPSVPPVPPFFGPKHLFGSEFFRREEDVQQPQPFGVAGQQVAQRQQPTSNGTNQQFGGTIFPKVELITSSGSDQQAAVIEEEDHLRHGSNENIFCSSPSTSSTLGASQQRLEQQEPTAQKRRKLSGEVAHEAPKSKSPSPALQRDGVAEEFGELLRRATRCNIRALSGNTNASKSPSSSSSMVVSMELNGVLYQGVLFAMDLKDPSNTSPIGNGQNGQ